VISICGIVGPQTVCLSCPCYTLSTNEPATWSVSSGFTVSTIGNGDRADVYATAPHGMNGVLTAVSNGKTYTQNIKACTASISGPGTVCNNTAFTIQNGTVTSWVLSPSSNSGFTITSSNSTSATVTATSQNGQTATLIANVSGGPAATKPIQACFASILGPDILCPISTFSLSNGQPATWSVTGDFNIAPPNTGSSVTVNATTLNGGSGILTAMFNGVPITKTIQSCQGIIGPTNVCNIETYTLHPGLQANNWIAVGSGNVFAISSSNSTSATVTANPTNGASGAIIATLTLNGVPYGAATKPIVASCGRGGGNANSSSSYILAYPNPVNNILTIEIDAVAAQNFLPVQAKLTFDVRLYDVQGNLLRNAKTDGGTVEFNVANLKDGIYYLHVYDGVNSTPEIHQIVIN